MRTIAILVLGIGCTGNEPTVPPTGDTGPTETGPVTCKDVDRATCVEIEAGDVKTLQDTVNLLKDDTAIVLAEGTWMFDNALTLRDANHITIIGQGIDKTILDFSPMKAQANGIDAITDDIVLEGFTVTDSVKDGIRVEDSDGVVFRRVKVTWSGGPKTENGAYALYPVRVQNVLMEDCEAYNASDAGIYVGQCQNAVIRNNIAKQNVAGIEIENTQFADVYGNLAEDNTGGLLVFDLPGNPIVGHDIRIHDNQIIDNNQPNFAPGGTVSIIPAGTGTVIMASRGVEIDSNTYADNDSTDIAIVSGLVIDSNLATWHIDTKELVGSIEGVDLLADKTGVFNFRTDHIWVHGNSHANSGTDVDDGSLEQREIGYLLGIVYNGLVVDNIIYDAIGESSFDAAKAANNSNDNAICIGNDDGVRFGSLDLENLQGAPSINNVYRPEAPFAPFDCKGTRPTAPEL